MNRLRLSVPDEPQFQIVSLEQLQQLVGGVYEDVLLYVLRLTDTEKLRREEPRRCVLHYQRLEVRKRLHLVHLHAELETRKKLVLRGVNRRIRDQSEHTYRNKAAHRQSGKMRYSRISK